MSSYSFTAKAESIRVLTFEIEPFFYIENGTPAGIDFEILNYFAKQQNQDLQIQWAKAFSDLLPMLQRGEGDVVAAALTITEQRRTLVNFTEPYFPSQLRLIERKGNESKELNDLSNSRVGVLTGSIGDDYFATVPGVTLVPFESVRELYLALEEGRVKAIASETSNAFYLLKDMPELAVGISLKPPEHYGFAVPKGSVLAEALSVHIERLKSSGIYFRILQKYLGPDAAEFVKAGRK
jgi:polar amino acid transport system substrate-binding protein